MFFETPSSGTVVSVGSFTWGASLLHNGDDNNNVARVSVNVLRRFLDPAALGMPD